MNDSTIVSPPAKSSLLEKRKVSGLLFKITIPDITKPMLQSLPECNDWKFTTSFNSPINTTAISPKVISPKAISPKMISPKLISS